MLLVASLARPHVKLLNFTIARFKTRCVSVKSSASVFLEARALSRGPPRYVDVTLSCWCGTPPHTNNMGIRETDPAWVGVSVMRDACWPAKSLRPTPTPPIVRMVILEKVAPACWRPQTRPGQSHPC